MMQQQWPPPQPPRPPFASQTQWLLGLIFIAILFVILILLGGF